MIARRTTAPRKAATIVAKKPSVVLGSKRFITSPARNAPTRPNHDNAYNPKVGEGDFYESGCQEASNQANDQPHLPVGCCEGSAQNESCEYHVSISFPSWQAREPARISLSFAPVERAVSLDGSTEKTSQGRWLPFFHEQGGLRAFHSSKASTQLTSLVLSGASIRSKCHESVMSIVMESGSLRTERLCHLSI